METKKASTTTGYIGVIGYILGMYWDNGKENETTILVLRVWV